MSPFALYSCLCCNRFTRDPNSPKPRFPKIKPAPSIVPYRDHSDLPTMVPGGKVDLNGLKCKLVAVSAFIKPLQLFFFSAMSKKGTVFDCGVVGKTRKCPKCDKVFPWASSLSRHIMTHSGLKVSGLLGVSHSFLFLMKPLSSSSLICAPSVR